MTQSASGASPLDMPEMALQARFVVSASGTRRSVGRLWLRVSPLSLVRCTDSEMTIEPQVPATRCHVRLVVAPTKVADPKKMANTKGKAAARPTTHPHAHKVTWVTSPSPEATVEDPSRVQSPSPVAPTEPPSVAGPSGFTRPPLF